MKSNSRLGLYHSQSRNQITKIKEKIEAQEKPWKEGIKTHIFYNWNSSIPRKWIDIKGKSSLKHIKKLKESRQPENFLAETHTYISNICQNDKPEPKIIIPKVNVSQVEQIPDLHTRQSEFLLDSSPLAESGSPLRITRSFPHIRRERFQTTNPLLVGCYSIINLKDRYSPNNSFLYSENDSFSKQPRNYLVNNFAIPSKITNYHKISPETKKIKKANKLDKEVDENRNRFKSKQESKQPFHIKSGLIGFKLSTVKFPSLDKKSNNYRNTSCEIISSEKAACDISRMSLDF